MNKKELTKLWEDLGGVPLDKDDQIELDFHIWVAGTPKLDIWQWFDEKFEYGLVNHIHGKE